VRPDGLKNVAPLWNTSIQITNHNLCVESKSNCDASNAPLHQENMKIVSNYNRTQMSTGNISHIALIEMYSIQIAH